MIEKDKKIIKHKDGAPDGMCWVTVSSWEDIYGPKPYQIYIHDDSKCENCSRHNGSFLIKKDWKKKSLC